jgi:3'-phosphoadenosine 5'-phosphosulfate sulfotransferase (PAPS reductase)/FAD synthetase
MHWDLYGKRILAVSGERADESKARQHYLTREFETGHASRARHVERWRPIHQWCEIDVWAIIARWKIRPHPAYVLGWGRLSCMTCIFGSPAMWASIAEIDPGRFDRFVAVEEMLSREKAAAIKQVQRAYDQGKISKAQYEKDIKNARGRIAFIKGQTKPLTKVVQKAEPYRTVFTKAGQRLVRIALSHQWKQDPIMSPWRLPAGAFGEASGPI